ncbi:MAG: hypothetical protein K2X47_06160 [Bdellovibrionales bacterium]|nr:hypothetical protein [Bdellovibrionales bacterium]
MGFFKTLLTYVVLGLALTSCGYIAEEIKELPGKDAGNGNNAPTGETNWSITSGAQISKGTTMQVRAKIGTMDINSQTQQFAKSSSFEVRRAIKDETLQ